MTAPRTHFMYTNLPVSDCVLCRIEASAETIIKVKQGTTTLSVCEIEKTVLVLAPFFVFLFSNGGFMCAFESQSDGFREGVKSGENRYLKPRRSFECCDVESGEWSLMVFDG